MTKEKYICRTIEEIKKSLVPPEQPTNEEIEEAIEYLEHILTKADNLDYGYTGRFLRIVINVAKEAINDKKE